jgi:hypothetical protein
MVIVSGEDICGDVTGLKRWTGELASKLNGTSDSGRMTELGLVSRIKFGDGICF